MRLQRLSAALLLVFLWVPQASASFFDVPTSHPNQEAISYLESRGVARGFGDRTFRPDQVVTRAEFAAFVLRIRGQDTGGCYGGTYFSDVPSDAWFADVICTAQRQGMIQGYGDGTARPLVPVSFVEAAKIVTAGEVSSADVAGGEWFRPYVEELASKNAIPTSISGFQHMLSRGEVAEILYRVHANVTTRPSLTYAALSGDAPSQPDYSNDFENEDTADYEEYFDYASRDINDLEDADVEEDDEATLEDLLAWDTVAEGIALRRQMSPPVEARLYATLAVAQRDVYALAERTNADVVSTDTIDLVSAKVLCRLSSIDCTQLLRVADTNDDFAEEIAKVILREVDDRILRDDNQPAVPVGSWTGPAPMPANAANWEFWIEDNEDVDLPPNPPSLGSSDDRNELDDVRDELKDLERDQIETIHAWTADSGNDTPVPLWLKKADVLLRKANASPARAAEIRSVLAMAMADAVTLAWDTKQTFWTQRPAMRDSSISTVIPTPGSPSYVSTHAVVSQAAALILGEFFPSAQSELDDDADEAAESRVWAGIQFPVDIEEGADMGEEVGDNAVEWYDDHR